MRPVIAPLLHANRVDDGQVWQGQADVGGEFPVIEGLALLLTLAKVDRADLVRGDDAILSKTRPRDGLW